MTGKQEDYLADVAGVFEVSKHDEYSLKVAMVDDDGEEVMELDEIDEPGRYIVTRTDRRWAHEVEEEDEVCGDVKTFDMPGPGGMTSPAKARCIRPAGHDGKHNNGEVEWQ